MMKILIVLLMLMLTACYEDASVTLNQAGIYKGKVDVHSLTAQQRQVILKKRFSLVQTDR